MAGNVKKGFGTYFLILILSIIAAFLVICVVMIFQPGKVILGYKYFTYDAVKVENQLTDNSNIDFSTKDIVRINSNYADIRVEKKASVRDEVEIVITNKSKGFAKANQNTDFTYSIVETTEDGRKILDISIVEPEGTIFFQKDVEIAFYVPYYDAENGSHSVSGKEFIITTNSGSVFIGNQYAINEISKSDKVSNPQINLSDLTIQTTSGLIYFYKEIEMSNGEFATLNNLSIRTDSGRVEVFKDSLVVAKNLSFRTQRGKFVLNNVASVGNTSIILSNGSLKAEKFIVGQQNTITGKFGEMNFSIKGGSFEVSRLCGSLIANDSIETATNSRIEIGEVTDDVSIPFLGNSSVVIGKVGGQAYLEGEKANINIKSIEDSSWIKTTGGNIELYTTSNFMVQSTTGQINVYFDNEKIEDELSLVSTSGSINLHILASLDCVIDVRNIDGEERTNNVFVEPMEDYSNPFTFNNGGGKINFKSNGKINVSLFSSSENDVA